MVVVTGICVASANRRNSSLALPAMMPPPPVEHRTLGFFYQPDDLVQRHIVGPLVRIITAQANIPGEDRLGALLLDVFRNINDHRTRPAGLRDVKRLFNDARDIVDVRNEIAVFDDRQGQAENVRLLESALADHVLRHLARDGQDRN